MSRKPASAAMGLAALVLIVLILMLTSRGNRDSGANSPASGSETPASSGMMVAPVSPGVLAAKAAERRENEPAVLSSDEVPATPETAREPQLANCQEGCMHCANLLKLSEYQAEYADMQWTKILETHRPEPSQVEGIRFACRQLADAVMLEWSVEKNAPVLQGDATIHALEKEIIAPALVGVATK